MPGPFPPGKLSPEQFCNLLLAAGFISLPFPEIRAVLPFLIIPICPYGLVILTAGNLPVKISTNASLGL